jgi:hypothetical protein
MEQRSTTQYGSLSEGRRGDIDDWPLMTQAAHRGHVVSSASAWGNPNTPRGILSLSALNISGSFGSVGSVGS